MNVESIKYIRRKSFEEKKFPHSNFQRINCTKRKSISSKKNPVFKNYSKKNIINSPKSKIYNISLFKNNYLPKYISNKTLNTKQNIIYEGFKINNNNEYGNNITKRRSFQLYQKGKNHNNKENTLINYKIKNVYALSTKGDVISKLEKKIKKVLNNMRIEIEKKRQNDDDNDNNIIETRQKKLSINPAIMAAKLLKKKLKKTILKNKNDLDLSLIRLTCSLGRANSFEFSEKSKQKLFKKLRNKIRINKKKNSVIYEGDAKIIEEDNSLDEDIDSDDSRGFLFIQIVLLYLYLI